MEAEECMRVGEQDEGRDPGAAACACDCSGASPSAPRPLAGYSSEGQSGAEWQLARLARLCTPVATSSASRPAHARSPGPAAGWVGTVVLHDQL